MRASRERGGRPFNEGGLWDKPIVGKPTTCMIYEKKEASIVGC